MLVLLMLACGDGTEVEVTDMKTGEAVDPATVPQEILDGAAEIGRQQSKGLEGAAVEVHEAWVYTGDSFIEPVEGARLVAAEITFRGPGTSFDIDDVDIIDADTGENFGSNPEIICLTDDGSRIDCVDPTLSDTPKSFRTVLIWAAMGSTDTIKLGYWGEEVAGPVELNASGRSFSSPASTPTGRASWTADGVTHQTLSFDLTHWSRARKPDRNVLMCEEQKEGRAWRVRPDASVFVEEGAPRSGKIEDWPNYFEEGKALVDYRIPEGCTPAGFHHWGEAVEIPDVAVDPPSDEVRATFEANPLPLSDRARGR